MAAQPETLTPNRTVTRPLRINPLTAISLLVVAIAIGGLFRYAGSLSATQPAVEVTRDLPAGAMLGPDDLRVVEVRLSERAYAAAVPGHALGQAIGRQLAQPAFAGQILARGQIGTGLELREGQLALTIPVKAETAVGGRLRPGDQVLVLMTVNKGKPDAETSVVLERVTVYAVGQAERLGVVGGSQADEEPAAIASLTLIVTREQAQALARARHSGELDVALLPK